MIKKLLISEIDDIHDVIVKSFSDVAELYGMTSENCPGNSAFLSKYELKTLFAKNIVFLGLKSDGLIGCVAVEKKSPVRYKIKLLSVKSEYRHRGYGLLLMTSAEAYIVSEGGTKIQLGMIYENQTLFEWYLSLGFVVDKVKEYKSNLFKIAFMEKKL